MAAGRKPGSSGGGGGAPAVDPRAPTRASLRAEASSRERAHKAAEPGDFSPDAPTRIMPPTPSLEERPDGAAVYNPHAPTQAMNLAALPDLEDPFAARATEVEIPSFSSEEAAGSPFSDDDGARVDLRPRPLLGERRSPASGEHDVVEISLSDMDPLSDEVDALPALADDDSQEDTHDTVVNMPLPASLRAEVQRTRASGRAPAAPRPAPRPPLPAPTVVERRSYSPAALFDDDPASVTDPRRDDAPSPISFHAEPGSFEEPPPSASSEPIEPSSDVDAAVRDGEPIVEEPAPRAGASERTAARPSLVSQPSGDPPPPAAAPDEAPASEDDSLLDSGDEVEDDTMAPELSDVSDDVGPPLLHKWKVVPTAIRDLERAPAPPSPAGFGGEARAKALHTVLWSPEDEAAARSQRAADERARNPFWAPTDAAPFADDDEPLESTEAAAPSDPRMAAAAYIHDAVAYLRSLSHFAAHLDDEVRHEFEGRVLGANEKLRRALAVLHSALDEASEDEQER